MIRPNAQFEKITDIKIDFFKEHNIKGIILDLDNTLIDLDGNYLDGIKDWINQMKQSKINFCIATNSVNKEKISELAKELDIPFVYMSMKPFKIGIKKAISILNEKEENIAEIGDQVFTDVWVSNKMNLFSILTNPISKDRFKLDVIKRKFEKWYLSKQRIKKEQ